MTGQTVGYVRVSSLSQNTERQYEALGPREALAEVFEDRLSGKSADRPGLAAMTRHVREGDTVRVASLDRLARNLLDLRQIVIDLTGRGVRVEFVKEALIFTGDDSPMNTLLLNMLGAVAEFERSLIRERQAEGIAIAKAKNVYKGRAPALTPDQVASARTRIADGVPKAQVARDLGVARQTLYTALATAKTPSTQP